MLSQFQVQMIVSQCIRRMTSNTQKYSRNKTLAQMGIISQIRFNGLVDHIYNNPTVGLVFYHHTLPDDAFDRLGPTSTVGEVEDVVITATLLPGRVINPIF